MAKLLIFDVALPAPSLFLPPYSFHALSPSSKARSANASVGSMELTNPYTTDWGIEFAISFLDLRLWLPSLGGLVPSELLISAALLRCLCLVMNSNG